MEAIEATAIEHEAPSFRRGHVPDRAVAKSAMPVRLGGGNSPVEQPGIPLVVALHPQPRSEEALARETNLVIDVPLLPA